MGLLMERTVPIRVIGQIDPDTGNVNVSVQTLHEYFRFLAQSSIYLAHFVHPVQFVNSSCTVYVYSPFTLHYWCPAHVHCTIRVNCIILL